ncbi:MICOS complex subunit mic25a [Liparis tanakae]|uniref:MICOS complex subunit mic25a n=1 Tax=Liparis tanakae TaxID=230148 RepID=A0A4Z2FZ11_9TELE|nr:MICOS complex subunit mic25a [Liparis tanakae]
MLFDVYEGHGEVGDEPLYLAVIGMEGWESMSEGVWRYKIGEKRMFADVCPQSIEKLSGCRSRNTDPVCLGLQAQISSCYRDNRDQTLRCSDLAKEYMRCINAAKKRFTFLNWIHCCIIQKQRRAPLLERVHRCSSLKLHIHGKLGKEMGSEAREGGVELELEAECWELALPELVPRRHLKCSFDRTAHRAKSRASASSVICLVTRKAFKRGASAFHTNILARVAPPPLCRA